MGVVLYFKFRPSAGTKPPPSPHPSSPTPAKKFGFKPRDHRRKSIIFKPATQSDWHSSVRVRASVLDGRAGLISRAHLQFLIPDFRAIWLVEKSEIAYQLYDDWTLNLINSTVQVDFYVFLQIQVRYYPYIPVRRTIPKVPQIATSNWSNFTSDVNLLVCNTVMA